MIVLLCWIGIRLCQAGYGGVLGEPTVPVASGRQVTRCDRQGFGLFPPPFVLPVLLNPEKSIVRFLSIKDLVHSAVGKVMFSAKQVSKEPSSVQHSVDDIRNPMVMANCVRDFVCAFLCRWNQALTGRLPKFVSFRSFSDFFPLPMTLA